MFKLIIKAVLSVVIIVLGVCFAYLNAQTVTINYYLAHSEMPLSLLLVLVLGLGFLLGLMCCLLRIWVLHSQIRGLKRALKKDA